MEVDSLEFQNYRLTRIGTEAATGYFDCRPIEYDDFDSALAWNRGRPNDEFMRKHLLRLIAAWEPRDLKQRIRHVAGDDLFLKALFFEACLLLPRFFPLRPLFSTSTQERLAQTSPLLYIKAHRLVDHHLHQRWIERLRPTFFEHAPLPKPQEIGLPPPVDAQTRDRAMAVLQPLAALAKSWRPKIKPAAAQAIGPKALTALALECLAQAGIQVDAEMRHEASLSPIALLRPWRLALSVDCGRHRYHLDGEQIAYGRGIELTGARVACVMEIVERASAYASIARAQVQGYCQPYPLTRARLSQLTHRGVKALDPNHLGLEAPYRDEPLYWLEAQSISVGRVRSIQVPAQAVFLFCNLDEVKLFSGLGSTGLGAGASLAEAKYKALLEVIERDSAAVVPYTPDLCFDVETSDTRIARLLQNYANLGIRVGFLDMTGPLGLPCCKSFVMDADGQIAVGTGAHLDAKRALLSALTETPYPFPHGPPSRLLAPPAVRVPLEVLPNYDQGDPQNNLELLEQLLLANGFEPIYVDLTRKDLNLPVVRAIVPGMEMMGEFDRFSRVHPRLYGYYLKYARST